MLPCDTSMSQSPHAALSHYQCGDNYPPKMRTNWLFIKGRASFSLRPLVPGMRRSSVAVLVLLPLATTTLPLNPDHNDSTPHPLIPPRMRKGYSTFRVRPRILKGLKRTFSKTEIHTQLKFSVQLYKRSTLTHEFLFQTLSDSDKKLLEKTKRILSSLGSYLKMELTNVDHQMKVFVKHTTQKQSGRNLL